MAIQNRLASPIIDAIQQHHGTTRVAIFIGWQGGIRKTRSWAAKHAFERQRCARSEAPYRYPGPKPSTREIRVISLADAVEEALRSCSNPRRKIEGHQQIIGDRFRDGQARGLPLGP